MNRIQQYLHESDDDVATLIAPPATSPRGLARRDAEDLRLLVWLNYFTAAVTLFPAGYVSYLIYDFTRDNRTHWGDDAIFIWMAIVGVTLWLCIAAALVVSSQFIKRRVYRRATALISLLGVVLFPVGWVSAIYAFVVLSRPSIKRAYKS